jgi:Alpha/beta hydrolase domain
MMKFTTSFTLILALIAAPASAKDALPMVSAPIPVTKESRPFLGAQAAMEAAGYVEEEYFLSGTANTYDWTIKGRGVKVIAGPGKYVTRILVRRPSDPKRFGGNVEVTVLNASLNVDSGGPTDFANMVKQGDVWIGITTKASTANALKRFDPVRYAPINWSSPVPPAQRCALPTMIPPYMIGSKAVLEAMAKAGIKSSWPESEDGLVWDMLGQLGTLLKSDRRTLILSGFKKPFVFMTGVSQSAIYIRTWLAGFHNRFRAADGKPVYDGYLGVVGPSMIRINQCAQDMALEDPLQKLAPPDVPFISISSEGEMWQARHTHQPDAFTRRGGIVSYEIAGASHGRSDIPDEPAETLSRASAEDMARAGMNFPPPPAIPASGPVPNDFVWAPALRGAYANLQLWARKGIRPPLVAGIALDERMEIKRDQYGNALGGLRMPYIDAPVASHTGYISAGGIGGIRGIKTPFTADTLKSLYPDHAAYVAKFSAATDRLVNGHWISVQDAQRMKAVAEAQPYP